MKPDAPGHNRPPLTYKDAGVDIDAGDALVEHIKPLARSTDRPGVMGGLGGYEEIIDSVDEMEVAGFRVHVLSLEQLIATKRAAGRPKDLAVIPVLEATLATQRRAESGHD